METTNEVTVAWDCENQIHTHRTALLRSMKLSFQAFCFKCEKSVTAFPILGGAELQQALSTDAQIEVMHLSDGADHQWGLNKQEKEHLRNYLAESSASM